ncbi:MAG: tRNA(fMet)-specific endonuclease VapC [Anaerolineae bacterium]|nr:tRNA(fMet)-specific endonuclease VapC [Anaerolineae bacterium]
MTTCFLDTNIFIRFITNDDPSKAEACYRLFKRIEKEDLQVTTSESVIAEVVYILTSKKLYNLPRSEVCDRLYPLISLSNLKINRREALRKALDLFDKMPIDFEDCLTIAHMERQQLKNLYSYDQDFDRVEAIQRLEP